MSREQADYVRGKCRAIAVNNQGIDTEVNGVLEPAFAPWADVLYAADYKWWEAYRNRTLAFSGYKVSIRSGPFKEICYIQQSAQRTFDPDPSYLVTGGNSGYQAIHLAVHFGVKRILLLGFDMKYAGKQKHWFGSYPNKRLDSRANFPMWVLAFSRLSPILKARGVEVLNCTPGSALTCFPRANLKEVL